MHSKQTFAQGERPKMFRGITRSSPRPSQRWGEELCKCTLEAFKQKPRVNKMPFHSEWTCDTSYVRSWSNTTLHQLRNPWDMRSTGTDTYLTHGHCTTTPHTCMHIHTGPSRFNSTIRNHSQSTSGWDATWAWISTVSRWVNRCTHKQWTTCTG